MARMLIEHEAQNIRGFGSLLKPAIIDLTSEQAVFLPTSHGNHILWNAGHIVWSLSDDIGATLGLASDLPPIYAEVFSAGSALRLRGEDYPPIADIAARADATAHRVADHLLTLDDEALSTPIPADSPLASLYPNWLELVASAGFHIGYHLGQIGLLRRMQGLPPAMR